MAQKKRSVGRPPKIASARALAKIVDSYLEECKASSRPVTVTGLAIALGVSLDTLWRWEKKPEFSEIIKRAKTAAAHYHEMRLFQAGSGGSIFWLKANAGWADRLEIDTNGDLERIAKQLGFDDPEQLASAIASGLIAKGGGEDARCDTGSGEAPEN